MRMTLHVYKTHDHDLMCLHQAGVLSIGQAAKKAVIAYYKGESLCLSTKTTTITTITKVDTSLMPWTVTFGFTLDDRDAEGITKWIQGIHLGYRNCFLKNVLRHYLDDPATSLFRTDTWEATIPESTANISSIAIPASPKKEKEELVGNAWVNAVANEGKKIYTNKNISDLDVLLRKPDLTKDQEKPMEILSVPETAEEKEDEFDPYEAYLNLRNGGA